jgi:UDP-N-acetylmuramate--alanine ligase
MWYDVGLMSRYHLIGIGGSGLSAIARVLLESGHEVSGSDRQLTPLAQELQQAGATVKLGHRAGHVLGADVVLRSSAISDDNVEVQAARSAGIPVLKRVDFLGQLLAGKKVIAVAGTHGKTTTTAMLAWMLNALGQDPSYVIGGVAKNLGRNAHAGSGEIFVIEADEYDHMFLGLNPALAVVTNVEHDHPDCYATPQDFRRSFQQFIGRLEPEGVMAACSDDPGAVDLLDWAEGQGHKVYRYGIRQGENDYWAENLAPVPDAGYGFDVCRLGAGKVASISLRLPGEHNVRNALAALIVADLLGLPLSEAAGTLGEFNGVGRRFEVRGSPAGVTLVDDYAHHPTEIRATLVAARARYPGRPLWAVWQPHTFSRTRMLFDGFVAAFQSADHVVVTDIYAAREQAPADGFSSRYLVQAMRALHPEKPTWVHYTPTLAQATRLLVQEARAGDVILVLTAGDALQITDELLRLLEDRRVREM